MNSRWPTEEIVSNSDVVTLMRMGLDLAKQPDITNEQKNLLKQRAVARSNKDWSESDALREQLQEEGIQVRDTDHGQIWSRLPNQVSL